MKAIVLSAGQGKRLLPYTARQPKCLLPVDGERSMLEVQLRALARCGIERATVLVGFGASLVDRFVATTPILTDPWGMLRDNLDDIARAWNGTTRMGD